MEFTLVLNADQINTIIRGLETNRDLSANTLNALITQVQAQSQPPQAPSDTPPTPPKKARAKK